MRGATTSAGGQCSTPSRTTFGSAEWPTDPPKPARPEKSKEQRANQGAGGGRGDAAAPPGKTLGCYADQRPTHCQRPRPAPPSKPRNSERGNGLRTTISVGFSKRIQSGPKKGLMPLTEALFAISSFMLFWIRVNPSRIFGARLEVLTTLK